PGGVKMPESTIQPYNHFSAGPIADLTPHETYYPLMPKGGMDSKMQMTPQGPPYETSTTHDSMTSVPTPVSTVSDSAFSKLEHKLEGKPGVTNPAALTASIGRKELGQAEMTRRSVAGRKKE